MEANGLYIGIDIDENISQVCYYEREDQSVKPVYNTGDSPEFINATGLREILDTQPHPEDMIYKMIKVLVDKAKEQTGNNGVEMLAVCLRNYSRKMRETAAKALDMMGVPKGRYILIGSSEAFAYYAFNAEPALFAQGAALFDYEPDGIDACFLQRISYKGNTILREIDRSVSSDNLTSVVKKDLLLKDVADEICGFLDKTLTENKTSSVYLTGPGFDADEIPQEILNLIGKKGHRIFAGQNLFVKGTCICALAKASPIADPFRRAGIFRNMSFSGSSDPSGGRHSSCIMACKNRITTGVGLKTFNKGESMIRTIIRPGANIDECSGEFECILTNENALEFELKELVANVAVIEKVDLSDIKKREDRMTRVSVSVFFPDEDNMEITVKDLGFGEANRAENVIVNKTISMTGLKQETVRRSKNAGVIMCDSKRALVPYLFTDTGRNIYTIEELVQYLYENIWLIDDGVINNELFKFIGDDTGNTALAEKLKKQEYTGVTLERMLLTLFKEVNYHTPEEVGIIEPVLAKIQNSDPVLKKYSIAETYMKNNCLTRAQKSFQEILEAPNDKKLPESFYAKVHHNMGVCFARMFMRQEAAECFEKAYELGHLEESRKQALYAHILSDTKPGITFGQLEYNNMKSEIEAIREEKRSAAENERGNAEERLEAIKSEYLRKHF